MVRAPALVGLAASLALGCGRASPPAPTAPVAAAPAPDPGACALERRR